MYCLCTRCIIVNSVQVRSEFGKFAYTAICMRKCTLWSDNTCVFTRFHSVKNANTQLIWSSDNHIFFLTIATQLFFFITYNKMKTIYHTVGTIPTFNRKIVEICKFDIPNTHISGSERGLSVIREWPFFGSLTREKLKILTWKRDL